MNRYKAYLRKRPHYGDMINEIEVNQPKIKYPDRRATFLRNTHYLSQFDGDLSFINLEDQESKMAKERILEEELRKTARDTGTTYRGLQASVQSNRGSATTSSSSSSSSGMYDGSGSDALYGIDEEEQRRRLQENGKRFFISKKANKKLKTLANSTDGDFMQFSSPRNDPRDEIDMT